MKLLRRRTALLKTGVDEDEQTFFARLGLLIVIGSIPGGVIGLLAQERLDDFFHSDTNENRAIVIIAVLLALFGILLWLADRYGKEIRPLKSIRVPDWFIGIDKVLVLVRDASHDR